MRREFGFTGFGIGNPRPAPAVRASWPFDGLGEEADWAFVGGAVLWDSGDGVIAFGQATESDVASLTAAATFDAAVSVSTNCLISVEVVDYIAGDVWVSLRGGSWVPLSISASGISTPVAVTSGAGSGFRLRGNAGGTAEFIISDITITLA